ncbi:uncharacterized protein PV06_09166 [Exophiala oligosperma]|uniref:Uncharacterized protein n=2 Tax=Chaetothyriales TaxID=34395 RepID=A0A0D2BPC2_9EURO|nr:uncharacterized protein PV06_09166 [Exophiala oligosperma]KAJ9643647.1 hypothetical protein H2204_001792 [Knufia peltigerae]KIW39392.1 hypothetical protein PV06_09166 [Exophiala oligosperma]
MPRGAEYDNGVPQSDNAIGGEKNIIHGGDGKVLHKHATPLFLIWSENKELSQTLANYPLRQQPTTESEIAGAKKAAPMPEGLSEVHDEVHSGGGSRGNLEGSGKGGHEPKTLGENKGLNA